jgi:hypothetical protein
MAGSLRLAYGHGRACLLYALATVLREKGDEIVHHLEQRRIDHGTSITADADQSGIAEPVEVKLQPSEGIARQNGRPNQSASKPARDRSAAVLWKYAGRSADRPRCTWRVISSAKT